MIFYSHSKRNRDKSIEGSKQLCDHINGVHLKGISRINKSIDLGFDAKELEILLNVILRLHDLGKYTSYFQNYLLNNPPINYLLKQHSRFGGIIAYNVLKDKNRKLAISALYLIFQHHSKLINLSEIPTLFDENLCNIYKNQISDFTDYIDQIKVELLINDLEKFIQYPDIKEIRKSVKHWIKKENNIKDYFLLNYFFSILIEADKLDASDTCIYNPIPINAFSVDNRFPILNVDIENSDLHSLSNNDLRNFCRAEVINNLKSPDILDKYLFTLTAPTGIGKTMISLDFAIKLKEQIKIKEKYEANIIYALPFVNIIEQALNEYAITLSKEVKILGHYQFADVFGESAYDDEQNYNQKLMSLDTWQCDVVITSFVQFFETLIGNRNKLLKKFNHYAGAIIILDEVQTLSLDKLPLIGAVLYYLSKFLKSRIILMTATKPKIFDLAQSEILNNEKEISEPLELLTSHERIFACFDRTKIIPLLEKFESANICEEFINKIFVKKWQENISCLVVCNTVNRSIEMYNSIKNFIGINNFKNPIFYLSTNIIPSLRFEIISNIKNSLADGLSPILVSTQVVEAGVDLDFDMAFREIAPIDSIIQIAGRVNRNNNPNKKNSIIYVVDLKTCQNVYGTLTYSHAMNSLLKKKEFFEKEYLNLVNSYFENISDSPFTYSKKIFRSMKSLQYESDIEEDISVGEFRIIRESKNIVSVFIEIDEKATGCLNKYRDMINKQILKENFEIYKKDFNQRIIAVPNYYVESLRNESKTVLSDNLMIVPLELVSEYYNTETGFIRKKEDTDKNKIVML